MTVLRNIACLEGLCISQVLSRETVTGYIPVYRKRFIMKDWSVLLRQLSSPMVGCMCQPRKSSVAFVVLLKTPLRIIAEGSKSQPKSECLPKI